MKLLEAHGWRSSAACVATLLALVTGSACFGAVTDFGLYKSGFHEQVSSAGPAHERFWVLGAQITVDDGNDVIFAESAELTQFSTSVAQPMAGVLSGVPGFYYSSPQAGNLSSLDAAYPPGDRFDFVITGGPAGGFNDFVVTPSTHIFPSLPRFSNFSQIASGIPAGVDFTFSWDAMVPNPAAEQSFVFFRITDLFTSNTFFETGPFSSSSTGITLAGGLPYAGQYRAEVFFSSRVSGGSGSGLGQVGEDLVTYMDFEAVPEPTTALAGALLTLFVGGQALRTWRRSSNKLGCNSAA